MTVSRISFERAHAFTAAREGGLTEHPADPGGITNYGVSLRFLREQGVDIDGDGDIDAADIRALTPAMAAEIMRRAFWEPLRCQRLPAPLGAVLYDTAVNCGPRRAVRLMQRCCNVVGEAHLDAFTPLAEDGLCGPRTLELAQALGEVGLAAYTARACVRARQDLYRSIVRGNPSLQVFLQGWRNRCAALLDFLAELEREA